jgi:hypothetical protein
MGLVGEMAPATHGDGVRPGRECPRFLSPIPTPPVTHGDGVRAGPAVVAETASRSVNGGPDWGRTLA